MRHLVCVRLQEGRAGRGARDIITTGGMSRQPVEPIDKAQHIRHEYVGDGEEASSTYRPRLECVQAHSWVITPLWSRSPTLRGPRLAGSSARIGRSNGAED